jgi:hypothetical protein
MTLIFLILRYTPYVKLDTLKALIITIVLMVLTFIAEFVYITLYQKNVQPVQEVTTEKFNGESCNTCKIEPFKENKQKCRVVCDGDSKNNVEGFTAKSSQSIPTQPSQDDKQPKEQQPKEQQPQEVKETAHNNKYYGVRYGNYDDRYGFGGMFYDEYAYSRNTGKAVPIDDLDRDRQRREDENSERLKAEVDEKGSTTKGYDSAYQEPGAKSERRYGLDHNRRIEGEIDDELPYSDYNHLPMAAGYKSHEYEYGYSFLPPEKWFPNPPRPPVCVTEHRSPILPMLANGTPVDVKEFHSSRRITPPDQISRTYIDEKLNAGR